MVSHFPTKVATRPLISEGFPPAVRPWTNNRYLCDLYGLVDLDTENVSFAELVLQR